MLHSYRFLCEYLRIVNQNEKFWFDVKKAYGQKRRLNPKPETEYEERISMNENQV
jgi:hypothetical protein